MASILLLSWLVLAWLLSCGLSIDVSLCKRFVSHCRQPNRLSLVLLNHLLYGNEKKSPIGALTRSSGSRI